MIINEYQDLISLVKAVAPASILKKGDLYFSIGASGGELFIDFCIDNNSYDKFVNLDSNGNVSFSSHAKPLSIPIIEISSSSLIEEIEKYLEEKRARSNRTS